MKLVASWLESDNLALVTNLCRTWNRGKLYEILGEYAGLRSSHLEEKKVRCWLYFENEILSGFSLCKQMGDFTVIEEIWGPFNGLFGDQVRLLDVDRERARIFQNSVLSSLNQPILLRGATDNHFAHGLARALCLPWFNGVVIASKEMVRKIKLKPFQDFSLRGFRKGDEIFFSTLHSSSFAETISAKDFRLWATASNVNTFVAVKGARRLGFIITEKRRSNLLGDFNMVVKPEYQSKGIGSALLSVGLNSLYERGVKTVIADYRTLNPLTHRIYSKYGFQPKRTYNFFKLHRTPVNGRSL
jgi:GNAT superfamily N-acetyltransferase